VPGSLSPFLSVREPLTQKTYRAPVGQTPQVVSTKQVDVALASVFAGFLAGVASRASRTALAAKKKVGRGGKGGKGGKGGGGGGADEEAAAGEPAPEIDTEELMKDYEGKLEKSLDVLRQSLMGIRAGRATPQLLDSLKVSAYESEVSINEVGTITATDVKTLLVTCFDESIAPNVEKAVRVSGLGYSATVSGSSVTIVLPELTTDRRTEYAKLAKDYAEKSRVAVRNVRQTAMKKIKTLEKKKSINEDLSRALQVEIESMVKKNIGECDTLYKKKEKEITQS